MGLLRRIQDPRECLIIVRVLLPWDEGIVKHNMRQDTIFDSRALGGIE